MEEELISKIEIGLLLFGYNLELIRDKTKSYEITIWKKGESKKTCHEISKKVKEDNLPFLVKGLIEKHDTIIYG